MKLNGYWKDFSDRYYWLDYQARMDVEYKQCLLEGRDVEVFEPVLHAIAALPAGDARKALMETLGDAMIAAPIKPDYPYYEPSDIDEIRLARPMERPHFDIPKDKLALRDRIAGAWYGRVCGCLLGKPVEGWPRANIERVCRATDNYPLSRYISKNEEVLRELGVTGDYHCWIDKVDGYSPLDDDTGYLIIGHKVLERFGRDFTSDNMSAVWTDTLTINGVATAEQVGFRNMSAGIMPPYSAEYHNPYREFVGAEIRADYFGYINPGDPETAAEMAWRDARMTHVKNGIYGAMFTAAAIAAAAVTDDLRTIIMAGIGEIPEKSRLYEDMMILIDMYDNGKSAEEAFGYILGRFNGSEGYDIFYTNSNAMIVTAAVLFGEGDFTKTICRTVEAGFDTDSNGATVGSIIGMALGKSNIPEKWTAPICGKLETSFDGYRMVELDEMVDKTFAHMAK